MTGIAALPARRCAAQHSYRLLEAPGISRVAPRNRAPGGVGDRGNPSEIPSGLDRNGQSTGIDGRPTAPGLGRRNTLFVAYSAVTRGRIFSSRFGSIPGTRFRSSTDL